MPSSCCPPQDKVVASRLPNHWNLKSIFITGIVYGLYLTLSSWVLFYVATHTSFFRIHAKMHDLRYKPDTYLQEWCLEGNHLRVRPHFLSLLLAPSVCSFFASFSLLAGDNAPSRAVSAGLMRMHSAGLADTELLYLGVRLR